jgi:hypothetical protein
MHQDRGSRKHSDDTGPAAMQDGDRFPESAGWRLMSQLCGGGYSLDHNVHNTRGHEGSTVLVILNGLRLLPLRESNGYGLIATFRQPSRREPKTS